MIPQIRQVFEDLNNGVISLAEAEQEIIDLYKDNHSPLRECICTHMTTGEHAHFCPKYINKNII